jgi:hypothetical protein
MSSTINGPFTATVNDCLPFSSSQRYSPSSPYRKLMHVCSARSRGSRGRGYLSKYCADAIIASRLRARDADRGTHKPMSIFEGPAGRGSG